MPLDPSLFRATLARFASGVTIVTTRAADGIDYGMTATSFSSLSLDPPLILVCVDHAATMAGPLATAEHFAVHILAAGQEAVAKAFARKEATDKFDSVPVRRGTGGVPVLAGALAQLECRVHARYPGGDHTIVVGEVLAASIGADAPPMVYYRGAYGRLQS